MKKTKTPKGLYGVEMEYKGKHWSFARTLQSRMDALGKSDKSIYEALDMDQRTFSGYKRGECFPPANVVFKLARELDCTADYLMGLDNATDHECSDISKKTGLPGEAVEILHEAVEKDNIVAYQLLLDLFGHILKEGKVIKEYDGDSFYYSSMNNSSSKMITEIEKAMEAQSICSNHWKDIKEGSYEPDELPSLEDEIKDRRERAREGEVILMAGDAVDYYCKKAASSFENVLLKFCKYKIEEDPSYLKSVLSAWDHLLMFDPKDEKA